MVWAGSGFVWTCTQLQIQPRRKQFRLRPEEEGSMKASRSIVSRCQISLAIIGFAAGLTMAGCGSDTGSPASTPAQVQALPESAVKGKGKVPAGSRQSLYRTKAQAAKDAQ